MLLCSYEFPPLIGTRPMRWAHFVRILSARGWAIDVLTIAPSPGHPRYDPESVKLLSESIQIYRTHPGPLHRLAYRRRPSDASPGRSAARRGRLDFLKALLVPDPAIEWLPFALHQGKHLLKANCYQLIVSSGYPFSCHLLGYSLKRRSRLPWVADSGDPWAFNPAWKLPNWRLRLDRRLEAHLLRSLDRLILTTEAAKEAYLAHYPFLRSEQIAVLPSCYEPAEFSEIAPESSNRFRLVYTGSFYAGVREPTALLAAMEQLNDLDFEVLLAGESAPLPSSQLPKQIRFMGFLPRRRTLALQKGASMLFFLGNRSPYPGAQLPAKLFEYVAAGRPILAIRYDAADYAAHLIEQWRRGWSVDNDPEVIAAAIRRAHDLWAEGKLEKSFELGPRSEFEWEQLGAQLDGILTALAKAG